MDSVIKKRLVGALVLLVLMLLLLPVLFSGQGRIPEARITDMPPAPALSEVPALNPERAAAPEPDRIDEIIAPDWVETATPAQSADTDTGTSRDGAEPLPAEAWSVQMGSFSSADNASRLLERLRSAEYDAYTRESPLPDGGTLTQVMVGPYLDQAEARQEMSRLAEAYSVSPLVVRFRP